MARWLKSILVLAGARPLDVPPSEGLASGGTRPAIAGQVPIHCGDRYLSRSKCTLVRLSSLRLFEPRQFRGGEAKWPSAGPRRQSYRTPLFAKRSGGHLWAHRIERREPGQLDLAIIRVATCGDEGGANRARHRLIGSLHGPPNDFIQPEIVRCVFLRKIHLI